MGKKKKRSSRSEWTIPPKVVKQNARRLELRRAVFDRQRKVPRWRLIIALFAAFAIMIGMFLGFLIPSQSLVGDLQSRGVSAWAEVTSSSRDKYGSPGNIKVRFDGPDGEIETRLHDWGGMRPEGMISGSRVSVIYDPRDPDRVLTSEWVNRPPVVTLPMLVTLLVSLFFLAGAIAGTVRRRILLNEGRTGEATSKSER
jgi:hypothetical protein